MENLIEENMGLVISIVNSFSPKNDEEREEYIQAGTIGLWKALKKYDPDRGCKLSPYARNPIRWEIIKVINSSKKFNNQCSLNNMVVDFLEICHEDNFWEFMPDSLTEEEKIILKLRCEGYNFSEICKKLERGRHYTKQLFMNAIDKLRESND
jgi:RNA polymerase sigma factor (sigma-70 family)